MRNLVLGSLAIVAAFAHPSAPAALRSASPRVVVQPTVVRLNQQTTITVAKLQALSVEVRLSGEAYSDGTPVLWRSLRLVGDVWRGSLPAPALRGVYPVVLRTDAGAKPLGRHEAFVRVFEPGTRSRPSFADPADVVRWWVRTVPHATLVALREWPRPAFDRRDPHLHRLFVVAYSPPGQPGVDDRRGMFVTAFLDGYGARWQLLEATEQP
jgi:hypothetical protein